MLEQQVCTLCGCSTLRCVGNREPIYLCPQCGLIHNLRSANSTVEEARYQHVIFDSPEPVARQQWEWLLQAGCRPNPKSKILDVGCGSGSFLLQAESHDLICWGVDISKAAIERARQRVGRRSTVLAGTLQDLDPEARFDVITLWDVLDHLDNPVTALIQMKRMLLPGGYIVARVRNGPLHLLVRNIEINLARLFHPFAKQAYWGVVHRFGFSVSNLKQLSQRCGYRDFYLAPPHVTGGRGNTTSQFRWLLRLYERVSHHISRLSDHKFSPSTSLLFSVRA